MTPEAKYLKIVSLVAMFAGLIIAIVGIVLCILDFDMADISVIASGFFGTAIGATGARKANVPSTAKSVVVPAIVFGAVCIVLAGIVGFSNAALPNVIGDAFAGIFSANVSLAAQRVVKALEKI